MKKTTRNIIIIVAAVVAAIGIVLAIVLPIVLRKPATDEFFTVTFDSNGGSAVASITNVPYNTLITEPAAPTKDGYTFGGWFSDKAFTKQWKFNEHKVTSNLTLYASWIYNQTGGLFLILNQETNSYTVGGIGDAKDVEHLAIPETYKGLPVTTIAQNAFADNKTVKSVFIPDNITLIRSAAFSNCTKLESVTLPSGLTEIASETFYGCNKLSSVNFPEALTAIGDYAFSECASLVTVNLPASLRTLGEKAFSGCQGIETLTVDAGNTFFYSRDNGVESNCIISVTSQDNKTVNTVVVGCKNSVIPYSTSRPVTVIGNGAFCGCRTLESISIPSTVITIGDEAFQGCINLGGIIIPSSVTKIGDYAFSSCEAMTSATFIEPAQGSANTGIKEMGQEAFSHCYSLTGGFNLSASLTSIGAGLLCGCDFDRLTIAYGADASNLQAIIADGKDGNEDYTVKVTVTGANGSSTTVSGLA